MMVWWTLDSENVHVSTGRAEEQQPRCPPTGAFLNVHTGNDDRKNTREDGMGGEERGEKKSEVAWSGVCNAQDE